MKNLTGLKANSVQQLKEWLKERGLKTDTLGKKTVEELLEKATKPLDEVLSLRQQLAKSSVRKYQAMENVAGKDSRARGLFQFYGANRTGRWAGRLLQPQNLPRNDMPDLKEARDLVCSNSFPLRLLYSRTGRVVQLIKLPSFRGGRKFIVADFSSIERVVLAWLAGEQWVLDAYRAQKDLYIATASQMFKVPLQNISKGSPLRQKGKIADLACIGEGQLVLTDGGLIPIEKITLEYKVWDGENFVEHDGVVRGEKGGHYMQDYRLDHFVWIEGQKEPVRFAYAAPAGISYAPEMVGESSTGG